MSPSVKTINFSSPEAKTQLSEFGNSRLDNYNKNSKVIQVHCTVLLSVQIINTLSPEVLETKSEFGTEKAEINYQNSKDILG